VWLSHDMQGYSGVESLTYRSLARIMEQVEGGDLVVNRGNESRPKDGTSQERDINAVDGYDAALKLAEANVEEMVKADSKLPKAKPSTIAFPTTYSDVYIRVQPFLTEYSTSSSSQTAQQALQFIIYLTDPEHQLIHTSLTQLIPAQWMDVWDDYDWVEDSVAEALRVGVEVVGQQYIVSRMGWSGRKKDDQEESHNDSSQQQS